MGGPSDAKDLPAPTRLRRLVRRNVLALRAWLIDAAFDSRALARLRRREHVLCIGDSHVRVMSKVRLAHAWILPVPLDGATASGVTNPQSRTSSLQRFGERLGRARPWQHVLIELGEVDCGFVIWHRAMRRGLEVEQQLQYTLDSYATFIQQVAAMDFASVSVLSVPLPTIGDDPALWGEVANMRKTVTVSQVERTELTLRFNAALEQRCAALGIPFVDITTGHFDPATGLIDSRFVRASHQDHHLADAPFAQLIGRQLAERWG